ncbi:MAG: hypothetical protein O2856_01070 [Planctomycetota bacterium]|nr:hypothetical protein [Planctomycetota bacterium]
MTNRKQVLRSSEESENEMRLTTCQGVLKAEPLTKNEKAPRSYGE